MNSGILIECKIKSPHCAGRGRRYERIVSKAGNGE
jgi:hypothetical protein